MASLRDGLGGEELSVSGIESSGSHLLSPYFLGSITTIDQISGANIYSTGTLQGENVYGDTTISGASIKGTSIKGDAISGTAIRVDSEGVLHSVNIGSGTAVYGAKIQAGSGLLSSNIEWRVFSSAFAGKPTVVCTSTVSGINPAIWANAGSITAGSFCAIGSDATGTYNWIAVGI